MNYIGSKVRLLPLIKETVHSVCGEDLSQKVFCDVFAGTGAVGRAFKKEVSGVIANDLEMYAFMLNAHYIGTSKAVPNAEVLVRTLDSLPLVENGFIYNNYYKKGRLYFSEYNSKKIDTIRSAIEDMPNDVSKEMTVFLITSLLESADKVANTASVYVSFLKKLKSTAQEDMVFKAAEFDERENFKSNISCCDANYLISNYGIVGDILYLDPPYNQRQYGCYYHMLNTITEYDSPWIKEGVTGMTRYNKSKWCSKKHVLAEFDTLLKHAEFKYVFLSYNNEGIMPFGEIRHTMKKYGKYDLVTKQYPRFKQYRDENRNNGVEDVMESIHILEKTCWG